LFSDILDIVEVRRKSSASAVFTFLKSLATSTFPDPGDSLTVKTFSAQNSSHMDQYELYRPDELLALEHVIFNLDLSIAFGFRIKN